MGLEAVWSVDRSTRIESSINEDERNFNHMKKTVRLAAALAALTATTLVMSACSSDAGSDGGSLSIMIWDNGPASIAAYEGLVDGFEEENPGVEVNLETVNTDDYENLLKTRLSGGKGPDIYGVRPPLTPDLVAGEYLTDISGEDWFAQLNDSAQDAPNAVQEGGTYAFPIAQAADGIIYNTELFEQAGITEKPTNFDELVDAAQALSDAGIVPFAMSAGDSWWTQFILFHLTAQNVSYAEPEANAAIMAGDATFSDTEGWRQTLESYEALIPYFMPDPVGTTQSAAQAAFLQGEAAMFPAVWILPEVRNTDLSVDYFNFPATEESDVPAIWGGYPVQLGINPGNGNSELASEFVAYLFSDEVYTEFLAAFGSFPVVDGIELTEADELAPTLLAAWEGVAFEASPPDTWLPGVQDAMLTGIQELTAGRVSVDDVLASMDAAVATALAQ